MNLGGGSVPRIHFGGGGSGRKKSQFSFQGRVMLGIYYPGTNCRAVRYHCALIASGVPVGSASRFQSRMNEKEW